ncbi:MAG: hypothetical protein ABW068_01320 [Candidatus Thiodiazotropha sp.]
MPSHINNDQSFRDAINQLKPDQQRELAGKFIASVAHLSSDPRISRAIKATSDTSLSAQEIEDVYKAVKAFATQTYTACGQDADWGAQAEHFVASAAAAALSSEDDQSAKAAWKTAMQARMAKNCEMILKDEGGVANEAENQYKLTEEFLA